jgi:hypothetical protein
MPLSFSTASGCRSAYAGVSQRAITPSSTASTVPARSTCSARSSHASGGGRCAAVQTSASRSTRPGSFAASHVPTIAPIESPT